MQIAGVSYSLVSMPLYFESWKVVGTNYFDLNLKENGLKDFSKKCHML